MEELNTIRKISLSVVSVVIGVGILLKVLGATDNVIIYTIMGILILICGILIKNIWINVGENKVYDRTEKLIENKIKKIKKYSDEELVNYIKIKFIKEGYRVKNIKQNGEKTEILLERNNITTILYLLNSEEVNAHAIYKMLELKKKYNVKSGIIITTGYFTKTVYELSKNRQVRLVNVHKLALQEIEIVDEKWKINK